MCSQIFLGGSEQTTLKDLNTALGKETIDMYNTGETRGTSQSYNMNYQKLGHDLMSIDELAVMDGGKCIVQVRGVRPFLMPKTRLSGCEGIIICAHIRESVDGLTERQLNKVKADSK